MRARLRGLGRLPWDGVVSALEGLTCAWGDLDGFHRGTPPSAAPAYSHVWGWSPSRWARVRVDGPDGVVGVLDAASDGTSVVTVRGPIETWSVDDGRFSEGVLDWLDEPVRLLEVVGITPVTFVHLGAWTLDGEPPSTEP